MLLWSTLVVNLLTVLPREPLLRRSFHAGGQPAVFLIRAGLLIVCLQFNVSGFHPVLARGWHGARPLDANCQVDSVTVRV